MSNPRAHHYVPEFFLAGFTPTGSRDDLLCVIDQEQVKRWRAKPKEVAHQRDFYRVEAPGLKADLVEEGLGKIEAMSAEVIRKIAESKCLPDGEDFLTLMTFVALMASRTPRVRNVFAKPMVDMMERMGEMMVSTREHWEQTVEDAKRNGVELKGDLSYEKMKDFIENKRYTIEPSQGYHILTLFETMKTICPLLHERNWALLVAREGTGEFICSDDPIGLVWTVKDVPALYGPGFGVGGTELTLPLTKGIAVCGKFEDYASNRMEVGTGTIAAVNSRTAMGSRCLYSASENFHWIDTADQVKLGGLFELIQAAKSKPKP